MLVVYALSRGTSKVAGTSDKSVRFAASAYLSSANFDRLHLICIMCSIDSSSLATTVSAVEGCGDLAGAARPLGRRALHAWFVCPSGKLFIINKVVYGTRNNN